MPYEIKYLPKIESWLKKPKHLPFSGALLESVHETLVNDPFPRNREPKLIKLIKGLKKNNPRCYRLRIFESPKELLVGEFRVYYTVTCLEDKLDELEGYVILLDISGPSDKDKKQAVERLKTIKMVDINTLLR